MEPSFCMRMLHLVTILLPVYLHQTNSGPGTEWAYEGERGPSHWHVNFPHCAGFRQSPVSIRTTETIVDSDWLVPFQMRGCDSLDKLQMHLENKGYTVEIDIQGGPISITGGDLTDIYIAEQLHFHWGKTDQRGSEHNIDGKYFPMEIHIVPYIVKHKICSEALDAEDGLAALAFLFQMHIAHYSTKYNNFSEALDKQDGLAVLAFLFEVGNHNDHLDHIINHFPKVPFRGNSTILEKFALRQLLPKTLDTYCRYYGSLTTPPCYESVIWFIFYETIEISENQLKSFRQIVHQNFANETIRDISDDYRPPQHLNQRIISCSKNVKTRRNKTANQARPTIHPGQQHSYMWPL